MLTAQEHGENAEDFLRICDWSDVSETNTGQYSVREIKWCYVFGPDIRSTVRIITQIRLASDVGQVVEPSNRRV